MEKLKKIALILAGIIIAYFIITFATASIANVIFPPSKASLTDEVVEDIGGDDFLVATLKGCLKIGEEKIPDGSFKTSDGKFGWYDAKNITYVDSYGRKGYMIVWKTTPDKYSFNTHEKVNLYISAYLTGIGAKCFIEYSWENNCVYGIILSTDNIHYSESDLMYDVLGLNRSGFDLVYTGASSSYSGSQSNYHTVVPDRYTLSRTDPGSYYDHYEYGDDYDIDDYLEVEGYD
ncbi:hypothetical protein [uncultured Methanobrevibacter sp.]|uniref:hypothetical protein n=1 Tax=uncultured Methanobrevibacter sp. TaxID=253161 RepID=UPI002601789F|nr:hypothetical protein [uncultured Methanobrevibacter sp.]